MRRQVLTISLSLLAIGAFAQKKELKIIEKALSGNDFSGALAAIKSAESILESSEDKYKTKYLLLKGKALAGQKKYSQANKVFNQLFDLEKTAGNKYTNEGKTIVSSMAQEVSNEAIDLYNNKKDFKAAAEKFYLTYKLSPTDTSFVYNAAVSSTQAKDYNAALKCYNELKDLGYKGIEYQYVATNKTTGKEEPFTTKSEMDLMVKAGKYSNPKTKASESKYATIVKNIALILKEQGKKEEALQALDEARAQNPKDINLVLSAADLYHGMGKTEKFSEMMKEAIALKPDDEVLYYNLGVTNFNIGRKDEARKYYEKAIELKPDYADAYMNLAVLILDQDKAIVEEMNNNLSNFKRYDELELQQKAVYKEALPYLEKADALNRSLETVRTLMGMYGALEMTGKESEFRKLYNELR